MVKKSWLEGLLDLCFYEGGWEPRLWVVFVVGTICMLIAGQLDIG